MFIIDIERIELVGHKFWFLVEWNRFCYILAGKYVRFSNSSPANHYLIVILILFC